ncbi:MAG: VCBS repeat-containing protein [Mariniblastus sp.]|nr:VCBS repeat-containing protein [Mariniblastus sp.]
MHRISSFCFVLLLSGIVSADDPPEFQWRSVEIDKIEIGYGLQLADVNGDGKTDIILADKKTFQWYENPGWEKHVLAKDLTERDNVCIAARDINGDGKCEIAVGGQWNYRDSIKDGAVFYLDPPADRRQPWTPIKLHNDPSTHRMHWVRGPDDEYFLHVKPLRGRGSVDGNGNGLRVLEYTVPQDVQQAWPIDVVCDFMHLSHNFHIVNWDEDEEEEILVAGKEGVWHFDRDQDGWQPTRLTKNFAGEIRDGKLPGGKRFIATVEPKHGNVAAAYTEPDQSGELWQPCPVLDDKIKDGHAVACADYLGVGSDQVIVGWRAMNDPGIPGIKLFTPLDETGSKWRETQISTDKIAVEDIKVADLDGDGQVDIVAAARQTKNLVILFNETVK